MELRFLYMVFSFLVFVFVVVIAYFCCEFITTECNICYSSKCFFDCEYMDTVMLCAMIHFIFGIFIGLKENEKKR